MSAFKKFDPQAFLERERLALDSTETLAALATLAGPTPKNEIRATASEIVSQCDTGAVAGKSIEPQRNNDTFIDRLDQLGKNQNLAATPAKAAKVAKDQNFINFSSLLASSDAMGRKCPDFVPDDRWRQAVEDGRQFLATWGDQARALGWTARELFGLHTPPERPSASYQRLARYDETGLIWLLRGRPVVALTETTAAIKGATAVLTYRKLNKPALGPLGDSLDDMGAAT
jgi:hypothetical protein